MSALLDTLLTPHRFAQCAAGDGLPVYTAPVGQRRHFLSVGDCDAYTRGYRARYAGERCPPWPFTPSWVGWRDADRELNERKW